MGSFGSEPRSGRVRWNAIMAVAPICLAMSCVVPGVAHANSAIGTEVLTAFNQDPILSKAELSRLRGGFFLPNGDMISLGVDIKQFVNNQLSNEVTYTVDHNFTVTQTTPQGTTTYTQTLAGGTINVAANGGIVTQTVTIPSTTLGVTKLIASFANGSIQSVIQNSANNIALQSVTTINLTTQGLASTLRNNMILGTILSGIQANVAMFRH